MESLMEEVSRRLRKVLELEQQTIEARQELYDFMNASNKKEEAN